MEPKDKYLAEAVLKRLCEGAQIGGIRFGPVLQILITNHANKKEPPRGQVYLNLDSAWTVFDSRPTIFPEDEEDLSEDAIEEQIQAICALRGRIIVGVELGEEQPHLILTLDEGAIPVFSWH